jgi:hypothetical protein
MVHGFVPSGLVFFVGLLLGWVVTTLLLLANVAEPWGIVAGWVVFVVIVTILMRGRLHG